MANRIDAHQHFWQYNAVRDTWITEEMSVIKRDFLPEDLQPVLIKNGIEGCIAVQADESLLENDFLLGLAHKNECIKGVVGWLDFLSVSIEPQLDSYCAAPKMKGFRYVLQGSQQRDLMLSDIFLRNMQFLGKYDFAYDILVYPDQLPYVRQLIKSFPRQRFIIDHLAKPYICDQKIDDWKKDIESIARYENVACKVSGLVTEANWKSWEQNHFTSYLDIVVQGFGTERLLFGSDWPVCQLAASYEQVVQIVENYFQYFSQDEKDNIFGDNAGRWYRL